MYCLYLRFAYFSGLYQGEVNFLKKVDTVISNGSLCKLVKPPLKALKEENQCCDVTPVHSYGEKKFIQKSRKVVF